MCIRCLGRFGVKDSCFRRRDDVFRVRNASHKACCLGLMFRSKRSTLAKRLWRSRVSSSEEDGAGTCRRKELMQFKIKSTAMAMLKRLKESQLECLCGAIESGGADLSHCVCLPPDNLQIAGLGSIAPYLLFCRLWRWPDLDAHSHLKQLPICSSIGDPFYVCCNPFHWSKLIITELPPPPYSKYPMEIKSEGYFANIPDEKKLSTDHFTANLLDMVDEEDGASMTIGDSDFSAQKMNGWCNIAYWEMDCRVGRLISVSEDYISIFGDVPICPTHPGLCIATLGTANRTSNESVIRTRLKIGLGIMIFKTDSVVWLYNRSTVAIFVCSPTMDEPNSRTLMVHKVTPGSCVNVFDYGRARNRPPPLLPFNEGPFNSNFVRISFAKGWGPKYSRRFVTSCPCSLELLMAPSPR